MRVEEHDDVVILRFVDVVHRGQTLPAAASTTRPAPSAAPDAEAERPWPPKIPEGVTGPARWVGMTPREKEFAQFQLEQQLLEAWTKEQAAARTRGESPPPYPDIDKLVYDWE